MYDTVNNGLVSRAEFLYSPKIIPLAYDEALTYIEQIYALVCKINNVIEVVNDIETDFDNTAKNYIDEQVAEIKLWVTEINNTFQNNLLNKVESEMNDFETKIDKNISDLESYVYTNITELTDLLNQELLRMNNNIKEFNTRLSSIAGNINKNNDFLLDYFNKQIEQLIQYVEDAMSYKTGNSIIVINPTNYKNTTLNKALKDLYESHGIYGITAHEYDSLELTAQEYDNLDMTAEQYDYNARFYLFDYLYLSKFESLLNKFIEIFNTKLEIIEQDIQQKTTMLSPFTGKRVTVQEVINSLAELHQDALTAEEYDNADMSAQEYDDLDITAYKFDWNSKKIIAA